MNFRRKIGAVIGGIKIRKYLKKQNKKEVVVKDITTYIKRFEYSGYSSLTSITMPNSVTSIGAFSFCSSLINIIIPNIVIKIGNCAFTRCSSYNYS